MLQLAAVVPHGDEVLLPEDEESKRLHSAMEKLAKIVKDKDVDGYVIITPHNIRIDTHIGVILTEHAYGFWKYHNLRIRRKYRCMRDVGTKIYKQSLERKLPVVGINFGALEGELSRIPLDWGSLIPLYFLPKKDILMITSARKIKREELIEFGRVIVDVLNNDDRKFALVVSADHAHAHSKDGPYGFSPRAEEYDEIVVEALKKVNFGSLKNLPDEMIEDAKPDSFWQLLILSGVLEKIRMKRILVEYGCPTYFGMAVAIYNNEKQ